MSISMGKQDIDNYLKKCKKKNLSPQYARDIANAIGVNFKSFSITLKRIRDGGEIFYKSEKVSTNRSTYKYYLKD